jgi:hypothetical protein
VSRWRASAAPKRAGARVLASRASRGDGGGGGGQQRCLQPAAPAALMQALAPGEAQLPAPLMRLLCRLAAARHFFANGVRRSYDDRAQGAWRLIVEALPEHWHAKETGGAESLESRIDFFEVAARTFLAIIHAEHELRFGFAGQRRGAAVIGSQRSEDLLPIMVFVGQQPDLPTLVAAQRSGTVEQGLRVGRSDLAQLPPAQAQSLRENEKRPGRQRRLLVLESSPSRGSEEPQAESEESEDRRLANSRQLAGASLAGDARQGVTASSRSSLSSCLPNACRTCNSAALAAK